jgi:hypothetical protein
MNQETSRVRYFIWKSRAHTWSWVVPSADDLDWKRLKPKQGRTAQFHLMYLSFLICIAKWCPAATVPQNCSFYIVFYTSLTWLMWAYVLFVGTTSCFKYFQQRFSVNFVCAMCRVKWWKCCINTFLLSSVFNLKRFYFSQLSKLRLVWCLGFQIPPEEILRVYPQKEPRGSFGKLLSGPARISACR